MDRAWVVQQFAKVSIVGVLGLGIGGVDRVIRLATVALSAPRALWAVITLGLMIILAAVVVIAAVLVIMAVVAVIVAPVFTSIIVAALLVGRAGSPFGFFGVGVSVCCLY